MITTTLKAPFPWFGGKSRVAREVWARFGDVPNYVEPFFGSGAVLLGRPGAPGIETVNDKDGFVSNFWRAVSADSKGVAAAADWPVNENDLHARHAWLVEHCQDLAARLEGDPGYYDVRVAGWWVWGQCCWIGSGWCSGKGPWGVVDGKLVKSLGDGGKGVNQQLPALGNGGMGLNRQEHRVNTGGQGVRAWFDALEQRLRGVRVCCGDWTRVTGGSVTFKLGVTGVFLDPPYTPEAGWFGGAYSSEGAVGHDVAQWCRENGENPKLRIALCGYEGEHDLPDWDCYAWKAHGGYGSGNGNPERERIWFSPHCLGAREMELDFGVCG